MLPSRLFGLTSRCVSMALLLRASNAAGQLYVIKHQAAHITTVEDLNLESYHANVPDKQHSKESEELQFKAGSAPIQSESIAIQSESVAIQSKSVAIQSKSAPTGVKAETQQDSGDPNEPQASSEEHQFKTKSIKDGRRREGKKSEKSQFRLVATIDSASSDVLSVMTNFILPYVVEARPSRSEAWANGMNQIERDIVRQLLDIHGVASVTMGVVTVYTMTISKGSLFHWSDIQPQMEAVFDRHKTKMHPVLFD